LEIALPIGAADVDGNGIEKILVKKRVDVFENMVGTRSLVECLEIGDLIGHLYWRGVEKKKNKCAKNNSYILRIFKRSVSFCALFLKVPIRFWQAFFKSLLLPSTEGGCWQ
jgi:hypothetical protein